MIKEKTVQILCDFLETLCSKLHKKLMKIQWENKNQPEHFDHNIDLYYQWKKNRNPMWLERGIFNCLALKGENILEIACGDGFNTKYFYSLKAKKITAVDFDSNAINKAKKKNKFKNIEYILCDIRENFPKGKFHNIICDAALEHFTQKEIDKLIFNIKNALTDDGIFSGYTIIEKSGGKQLSHHEYEFKNKEDLLRFFKPFFNNVCIFETTDPERFNLYFWASDSAIPFSNKWENVINFHKK